jgi:hypothetical protein
MTATTERSNQNESDELARGLEVLFNTRSESGRIRDLTWRVLSSLMQQFRDNPTQDLAGLIAHTMGTYTTADEAYRWACSAYDDFAAQ